MVGDVAHICNRGVDKRKIFNDKEDYRRFRDNLFLLNNVNGKIRTKYKNIFSINANLPDRNKLVEIFKWSLLPNHFHLLLQQKENRVLENFMRSLITRYCIYFNKKYDRVGPLFQGIYKAVLITEDSHLLHLSRYIHLNPSEFTKSLINAYSSYPDYLKLRNTVWLNPNPVMKFFENKVIPEIKKFNKYKDFVEKYRKDSTQTLRKLILE